MRVLVACEESQRVCTAFRNKGHEAYSCDILEPSGGHPEWHIHADVAPLINGFCSFQTMDECGHNIPGEWDLIIAFPPCTYISNAGARWLYHDGELNIDRYNKGVNAANFLKMFLSSKCDKICVENPTPSNIYNLPSPSQVIQPYMFGHPFTKRTLLWLKNLPLLQPTRLIKETRPYVFSGSYNKTGNSIYSGESRKGGSSRSRSKTFEGIALAMAEQWG